MADMKDLVKVAVDAYRGTVDKFSVAQSQDTLRQALIAANNGSTKLNYRDIRDGKCVGLFTLLEEILANTVVSGIQENDFFNTLVEYRDVAAGDELDFYVENNDLFTVSEMADGSQAIRRQRLGGYERVTIPTTYKGVRVYEEMNRVLSGQVDLNHMIDRVSASFQQKLLNDVYALWIKATAEDLGGITYFPTAGTYDEDKLLSIIDHCEAASGKRAVVLGTKKAVRNMKESVQSNSAKEELHKLGAYGTFFGTPVVTIPQRHKLNSTEFVYPDNMLTIVATDEKPIKCVREGSPLILSRDPADTRDLTHEYTYAERYGVGLVLAGQNSGIGRYEIAE